MTSKYHKITITLTEQEYAKMEAIAKRRGQHKATIAHRVVSRYIKRMV